MEERIRGDCLKLMNALGYDFCTLEFAVRDGIPYAIDFLNPAPDAAVALRRRGQLPVGRRDLGEVAPRAGSSSRRSRSPTIAGRRSWPAAIARAGEEAERPQPREEAGLAARALGRPGEPSPPRRLTSSMERPAFTLGVEEEFQIIDPETRELRSHVQEILDEGKLVLKERVKPEMHQSVIEIGTGICKNIAEVRQDVGEMRTEIIRLAAQERHARRLGGHAPVLQLGRPEDLPRPALRLASSRRCSCSRGRT